MHRPVLQLSYTRYVSHINDFRLHRSMPGICVQQLWVWMLDQISRSFAAKTQNCSRDDLCTREGYAGQ